MFLQERQMSKQTLWHQCNIHVPGDPKHVPLALWITLDEDRQSDTDSRTSHDIKTTSEERGHKGETGKLVHPSPQMRRWIRNEPSREVTLTNDAHVVFVGVRAFASDTEGVILFERGA